LLTLPPAPLSCFLIHHTSPPSIYTLSLHDALPIFNHCSSCKMSHSMRMYLLNIFYRKSGIHRNATQDTEYLLPRHRLPIVPTFIDRKSTRLNSSHVKISYAVFCLKKKNKQQRSQHI